MFWAISKILENKVVSSGVKLFEYDDGSQASYWLMSEFGNEQAGSIDIGTLYVECQGSCVVSHNGVRPVITVQKGHLQ